jgi:tetratricopeptide (TPR) repeat protein
VKKSSKANKKPVKGSATPKKGITREKKPDPGKGVGKGIYILILIVIVCIAFARTTNFDFVNIDDASLIYDNPTVTDHSVSYARCFEQFIHTVYYKPIVILTWKAEYDLFGDSPSHFHLINWLLHLANTLLLFFIGLHLFRRLYNDEKKVYLSAFLLALLFSINPLRIESVAWATERKDVLFSLFFLLSWLCYIRFIQTSRYLFIIMGSVLYVLSGLSKSMGIPLVAILFLTDFWFQRKLRIKTIVEKSPYIIAFAVLLMLYGIVLSSPSDNSAATVAAHGEYIQTDQITSLSYINDLPVFLQKIITTSYRFILFIVHSFIPVKMSIIYPHNKIYGFFGQAIFIFPFIVAFFFWLGWRLRRKDLYLLGGLAFFLTAISPALVQFSPGQAIFLSDRYTYIPSIGLFFILIVFINKLNLSKTRSYFIYSSVFLFYFFETISNIGNWKNSETLFSHALTIYPQSGLAHLNLGLYYRHENDYDNALQVYTEGIGYQTGYLSLYVNRSRIYLDRGKPDSALSDLNKCLSLNPELVQARINRGVAYAMKNEPDSALSDFNKAQQLDPENPDVLTNLGLLFYQRKQYPEAISNLQHFLKIKPTDADNTNLLGLCYFNQQQPDSALVEFNKAITLNPAQGAFYYNRSLAFNSKKDKDNALSDALKAQQLGYKINPEYIEYLRKK